MDNELLEKLVNMGVDKTEISTDDLNKVMQGKLSGMLNFTVPNNQAVKDFLDKEKIDYTVENDKIKFSARIKSETVYEAEDTKSNRKILDDAHISYQPVPKKSRVRWVGSNAAILAIGVINPIVGIIAFTYNTLRLIAKKRRINNSFQLANPELERLQSGEIVMGTDRFGRNVLRQLDKETNTIMSVQTDSIKIPDKIFQTELTDKQKQILQTGGTLKIKDENGNTKKIRIDLLNESGLASMRKRGNETVEKERIGFKL